MLSANPYEPAKQASSSVVSQYGETLCTRSHFLFRRIHFRDPVIESQSLSQTREDRSDSLGIGGEVESLALSQFDGFRTLEYNGWWFVQRVLVDEKVVWWAISWLTLERRIRFQIPGLSPGEQAEGELDIDFGRRLQIKRFTFRILTRIIYDEIN
ncbi:MAG: hypothetical protein AAF664_03355 [Planctomycetota bacterium]